jgi:hypothetical protein
LGIYSGRRNVTFSYYTGRLLPDQPDDAGHAYCAVFTILQLAIEVTGFTLAENWKWSDPLTDGGALLTHPASEVVDWPPRLSIDDGVVDDLPRARLNGLRRV